MQYGVPLLKGTWLTSLYREDRAPQFDVIGTIRTDRSQEGIHLYIDQNTFGSDIKSSVTGITQTESQFAGLCLNCHPKSSLTNGSNHTWKSKDRIHESVKGWKTADATIQHNYPCSKCHAPHNSRLPRLMITDCLESKHKGFQTNNTAPHIAGSGRVTGSWPEGLVNCGWGTARSLGFCPDGVRHGYACGGAPGGGSGRGRFPGNWNGGGDDWPPGYPCAAQWSHTVTCHESYDSNQYWNTKTLWSQ